MNAGRWYPTATTLGNGDILVVSGKIDDSVGENRLPEVFQVGSNTWRDLTNAQITLDNYPRMHLAPNGRVFNSGPSTVTRYLDTSGTGAWTVVANHSVNVYRNNAPSVTYDNGKVLVIGGGNPPTNTAEVIDLNAATPAWRSIPSMAFARRQHNATLLPDGKVLVTGGTSGPGFNNTTTTVLVAEMWDPATENWTTMASQQFRRIYHSSAVLLPDGRVLTVGGDNIPATEVYEPPYLFKGARPTISSAPTNVNYGQTFFVETPNAASITEVTWIRLSSVTHANNMEQRFSRLSFSQVAEGLNVVAPANPNLAPPGYYMLFILNSDGAPSVAEIVRINAASGDTIPPNTNITAGPTGTITVNTASFTWSGNDNITPTESLAYATRLDPLEPDFSAFGSATTKSYSNLANGDYTFYVKARDQAGNESTPATRAFTVNVTGDVCPTGITVDNLAVGQSDSQRSFTGGWALSGKAGPFAVNSLYSNGGGLDTYIWKSGVFHKSQACTYRVDVWWTQGENRSTTVPITVSGHTGGLTTKNFNERINGGKWNTHGTYTFPSGAQGTVQVTDQNGQAAADAVRFVFAAPDMTPPGNVSSFSATNPGTGSRLNLTWVNPSSDFSGVLILRLAGTAVTDAPVTGQSYTVGQVLGSSAVIYNSTGTSFGDTGLTNGTTYHYKAFAFDAARNYAPGIAASSTPSLTCPAEIIRDNLAVGESDSQRSFTGGWALSGKTGPFGANSLYSNGGGLDTYTWKSGVFHKSQACTYRVDVWWTQGENRSTTVPITVTGHTGGPTTKTFNEQINGGKWNTHGTYTFPSGAQGTVQVTDQNGQAAADAVRFVRVP